MLSLAELGGKVASARKNKGLSQLELARKAGVSRATIDLIENSRAREIGYSKLARILLAVGLELKLQPATPERPTLDDLLKENGDQAFSIVAHNAEAPSCIFTLIALNCAIRNGDAHLKNFGILYDEVAGEAHLAPAYDLVTTSVYLPQDRMALTLNGTNQWPAAKDLLRFAESRSLASRKALLQIFERISDALSATSGDLHSYAKAHPEFDAIGRLMLEQWETGRQHSLTLLG